jgi:hypothetical protein
MCTRSRRTCWVRAQLLPAPRVVDCHRWQLAGACCCVRPGRFVSCVLFVGLFQPLCCVWLPVWCQAELEQPLALGAADDNSGCCCSAGSNDKSYLLAGEGKPGGILAGEEGQDRWQKVGVCQHRRCWCLVCVCVGGVQEVDSHRVR